MECVGVFFDNKRNVLDVSLNFFTRDAKPLCFKENLVQLQDLIHMHTIIPTNPYG